MRLWQEEAWERGFVALKKFKAREGHCLVPRSHIEGTFRLGKWVATQRHSKEMMTPIRKKRLDAAGFVWDPYEALWENGFAALKNFKAREGHCLVPRSHIEGTFRLGQWVAVQRYLKDSVPLDRKRRLDAIGFVWNVDDDVWENCFAALKKFKARQGHCLVPALYCEGNLKLGYWVTTQRRNKNEMLAGCRTRLTKIGFVWDVAETAWERGFAELKKFKEREGHCLVPKKYCKGSYRLGYWVATQRRHKNKMSSKCRKRLNEIGFVWRIHDTRVRWTQAEYRTLKAHSKAKTPVKKISKQMKRTVDAVRQQAFALGIGLGHQR